MKAAVCREFGKPLVIEDVDLLPPGDPRHGAAQAGEQREGRRLGRSHQPLRLPAAVPVGEGARVPRAAGGEARAVREAHRRQRRGARAHAPLRRGGRDAARHELVGAEEEDHSEHPGQFARIFVGPG